MEIHLALIGGKDLRSIVTSENVNNVCTCCNQYPLHIAAELGRNFAVSLLLSKGAIPTMTDPHTGLPPVAYAYNKYCIRELSTATFSSDRVFTTDL